MMIADLGERAKPDAVLPSGAFEIEMRDPLGGPARYAYIATDAHPILSPLHYVDYDAAKNSIDTDHYRFGYTRGVPSDYAPQSRKHENGPNLLDRFKIRVRATVLKFFHFNVNEDKVDNRLLAWKVGPVRVVRLLTHSVRVVFGIRSPEVTNYDFFYRDCVENPFKVRFPWVPRILFGDIQVRMDLDFTGLDGYAISWSRMNDGPLRIGDPKLLKISEIRSAARGMDCVARRRTHDHPDHRAHQRSATARSPALLQRRPEYSRSAGTRARRASGDRLRDDRMGKSRVGKSYAGLDAD